jgi:hypothetical protein
MNKNIKIISQYFIWHSIFWHDKYHIAGEPLALQIWYCMWIKKLLNFKPCDHNIEKINNKK